MEEGGKKLRRGPSIVEIPPEVFLQMVLFLSKESILKVMTTNKRVCSFFTNSDLYWRQLCYVQHGKNDEEKKSRIDKWSELYSEGYKEMFLCENVKRYNKYSIIYKHMIDAPDKPEEAISFCKEFDEKNQCNITEQLVIQKKKHTDGWGVKEDVTIKDCFDFDAQELCYDEGVSIFVFGVHRSETEEIGESKNFREIVDDAYPIFMFLSFEDGGNHFGNVFIEKSTEVFTKYWDGQIEYEKDALFSTVFELLYGEYGEGVKMMQKFEEIVKKKIGRTDKYIFNDLKKLLPDHILKYDLKDNDCMFL